MVDDLTTASPTPGSSDVLDRLALAVNSSLDLDEVLKRLASLAREALPADRCSIFLLDDSGTRLVPTTYVASPTMAAEIARLDPATRPHFRDMPPIDLNADPSRWRAFMGGRAVPIPNLSKSALAPPDVAKRFRARSAVVVPLMTADERLGVLALDWTAPKEDFSEPELALIEAIGAYASLAIRNAGLFGKLDEKTRALGRLVGMASALNSSLSLHEVLNLGAQSFAELLGTEHCTILLVEDVLGAAWMGTGVPGREGPRRLASKEASDLTDLCRGSVEPVLCERASPDAEIAFSLCPSSESSVGVFPLARGGKVHGFVLAALSAADGASGERVELGRALAGLIATAMERAELHESLRRQLQHTEVLHGLSDTVADASDLSRAVVQLNRLLGEDIGIQIEGISIANERIRTVLDGDAPDRLEMEAIRTWRADGTGNPLRPRKIGGRFLVPIVHRRRVQGVLRVRVAPRSESALAEGLLVAVGTACAEVLHKAALRRDLAQSEHRLAIAAERDRIARELHESVGQLITGLGIQLTNHAAQAPDDEWRSRLEELAELTARGSRQMRDAVHSLLFFQVRHGLVRSLRELAHRFGATSGITTTFRVRGRSRPLEPSKEDALFRVAHEALTNVQRHSGSPSVSVTLAYEREEVALTFRDKGSGLGRIDPFRKEGHFGLLGLRRRVEESGGELIVANALPQGVLIEARVRSRRRRGLGAHPSPHR